MSPQRRGLGRGLEALLSSSTRPESDDGSDDQPLLGEIDIETISPNPEQPRVGFDEAGIEELADSIRVHGVLQPLVVERDGHGGYRLIAGERRLRAARRAGLRTVPALVRPPTESRRHALELALVENLQRADLGALEEAAAYARLADAFGLSHEAIGLRIGRSRSAVANTLRLLQLPASIQQALGERRLSAGHARALLALDGATAQELATRIEAEGLSVRATERAVQQRLDRVAVPAAPAASMATAASSPPGSAPDGVAVADRAVAEGLEDALGTPVRLERRRRGGRLIVEFYDDDQLCALYTLLGGRPL